VTTKGLIVAGVVVWTALSCAVVHGQPGSTVWDGVYTQEQAARGAALYTQHCGACHAPTLTGAEAPALTGIEFNSNWNMLTLGDLFERIRTSMPQDDPDKLTAQQKVDILAHMLSVGNFPAGMTDLPRDAQVLSQIRFLSTRP
jgi:mono/diheme cytochrome c family protein